MKFFDCFCLLVFAPCLCAAVAAQESDAPSDNVAPDFEVQSTVVKKVVAVEPAPLAGMVPVEKEITITQHVAADPGLAVLPQSEPTGAILSEAAVAHRRALAALLPKRVFVPLSATVFDGKMTRLRWQVPGEGQRQYEAWSALDFSVFAGMGSFVHEGVQYDLMLGLGLVTVVDSAQMAATAARKGLVYVPPVVPVLPPTGTAFYTVTQGDATDVQAVAPVAALHAFYAAHAAEVVAAHEARLVQARAREAVIRAHPPEPKDVTIHFWKQPEADVSAPEGVSVTEREVAR